MPNFYRFEHFKSQARLLQLVTTKSDAYPYSFSLALHTGEEKESIIHNRQKLVRKLQTKSNLHFIVANQTHSDIIRIISEEKTQGWNSTHDAIQECDAMITDKPNIILSILTADCVPILLYDTKKNVVAAIHAGWKGTKAEITYKTVKKMQKFFNSKPEDIIAGIAPSIGSCCYEVGEDVAKHFFQISHSFTKKGEKYMLDLAYINKIQLLNSGLHTKQIEMSNVCTSCNVEHFFSYRKEKGCSGRFMSMIGLRDA
jgi:YfiH family protein